MPFPAAGTTGFPEAPAHREALPGLNTPALGTEFGQHVSSGASEGCGGGVRGVVAGTGGATTGRGEEAGRAAGA